MPPVNVFRFVAVGIPPDHFHAPRAAACTLAHNPAFQAGTVAEGSVLAFSNEPCYNNEKNIRMPRSICPFIRVISESRTVSADRAVFQITDFAGKEREDG